MRSRHALAEALELPVTRHDDAGSDPGYEQAWADEIQRRLAAYERGETKPLSAADFLSHLSAIAHGQTA